MEDKPKNSRRWFRFSLRTLLMGVAFAGVVFARMRWAYEARLRSLDAAVQSAEHELEVHQRAVLKVPGTVPKWKLRRFELKRDQALMQLERFRTQFRRDGERLRELDHRLNEVALELAENELQELLNASYNTFEDRQESRRRIRAIKVEMVDLIRRIEVAEK